MSLINNHLVIKSKESYKSSLEYFYKTIILNYIDIFDLNEFLKLDDKLKESVNIVNINYKYFTVFNHLNRNELQPLIYRHSSTSALKSYISKLNEYLKQYPNLHIIRIIITNEISFADDYLSTIINILKHYSKYVIISFKMPSNIIDISRKSFYNLFNIILKQIQENPYLLNFYASEFKYIEFRINCYTLRFQEFLNKNPPSTIINYYTITNLIEKVKNVGKFTNIEIEINYKFMLSGWYDANVLNNALNNRNNENNENDLINSLEIMNNVYFSLCRYRKINFNDHIKYYLIEPDRYNVGSYYPSCVKEFNFHKYFINHHYNDSNNNDNKCLLPSEFVKVKYLPRNNFNSHYIMLQQLIYYRTYGKPANKDDEFCDEEAYYNLLDSTETNCGEPYYSGFKTLINDTRISYSSSGYFGNYYETLNELKICLLMKNKN